MKGWVDLVGWPKRTVYRYKWLPIRCRPAKFAGQRSTFYHWATPLTIRTASQSIILAICRGRSKFNPQSQIVQTLQMMSTKTSILLAPIAELFCTPLSRWWCRHNTKTTHHWFIQHKDVKTCLQQIHVARYKYPGRATCIRIQVDTMLPGSWVMGNHVYG